MKFPVICFNIILLTIFHPIVISCESAPYNTPKISIPTAGNSWVINDLSHSNKIITGSGISNWSDNSIRIRTYFRLEQSGDLSISFRAKVSSGSSVIQVTVGSEKKTMTLSNIVFDTLNLGTFRIEKSGYQWIELQGISRTASTFAEVTGILINGSATVGKVYFVKDDFYFGRRGPSVHLRYEIPTETSDIVWFYNEITIPEGNDIPGSYYMANGFADGYFGIQCNSATERRILFSKTSCPKQDLLHGKGIIQTSGYVIPNATGSNLQMLSLQPMLLPEKNRDSIIQVVLKTGHSF